VQRLVDHHRGVVADVLSERYWPSITVWTLLVPRLAGLALPLAAKAARPVPSMGRR
jgi:hypothetical protein